MSNEIKIPFGYKRVFGEAKRGDGIWNGEKFVKVRKCWPSTEPTAGVLIRKCEVVGPEIVLGELKDMEWSE